MVSLYEGRGTTSSCPPGPIFFRSSVAMKKPVFSSRLFCASSIALMLAVVAGVPGLGAQADTVSGGMCATGDGPLCYTEEVTSCNAAKVCTTTTYWYYYHN